MQVNVSKSEVPPEEVVEQSEVPPEEVVEKSEVPQEVAEKPKGEEVVVDAEVKSDDEAPWSGCGFDCVPTDTITFAVQDVVMVTTEQAAPDAAQSSTLPQDFKVGQRGTFGHPQRVSGPCGSGATANGATASRAFTSGLGQRRPFAFAQGRNFLSHQLSASQARSATGSPHR